MKNHHAAYLLLQIDLGIQAIYWLISVIFFSFLSGLQHFSLIAVAVLMLLDGLAYGYFVMFDRKGILGNDYVLLGFLLVNAILSITDQAGIFDFIILGLNLLAILVCLLTSDQMSWRRKKKA
jgi:hypothetical protein